MSLAGVTAGKLTVTAGADPSAPAVGAQGVAMAQFKLAAANEDIKINRVALYQGGTISNTNLNTFKLYEGSTLLADAASVSSKNLVSFVLATPFLITKGTTKTFDVKGNIGAGAKSGDTIVFYIENAADVYGIGQSYGFGTGVDFSAYDNSVANTEASNCTVSGGQLTFSSSGPSASNVRGTNVDFMDFSVAAGVNTEIKSLKLELYFGGVKGGATSTNGYITNVRIVDANTNATVGGPLDLANNSSWTDIGTTGAYHDFTDTITIAAGTSRNFKVLADLNTSLSAGALNVVLGSTASAYTLSTTAGAKNTDNNQWISDIVPSTHLTGKTMTFTTSALTVSLANSPATKTISAGDIVDAVGIVLAPGTSQTARVTSVKVAGYLGGSTYNNFTIAALGTAKITDTVESIELYDDKTKIGATKSFGTDGYATFDNLNVSVPSAGKILIVKAKTSSNATTTGAFSIGIVANATDVVAYDMDNNSITPDTGTVNITATPTVQMRMSTGGTVQAALNSDYPSATVAAGTSVNVLSTKFYGTNQAMKINKLVLTETGTNNLSSATITYAKDAAGTLESKSAAFIGANASFLDLNIYVPKNDWSKNVTVAVAISDTSSGSTSGDTVSLALNASGFEAVAADGGTTKVTSFTGTVDGATNHTMIIRKAVPIFTNVASTGGAAKYGASLISTFKVGASSGSVSVKKVKFATTLSDGQYGAGYTDFTVTDMKVYRNGTLLTENTDYRINLNNAATSTAANQLNPAGSGSMATTTTAFYVVFDNGTTGGEEVITAGAEVTYDIVGTFSGYESAKDSITTSIAAFGGSETKDDYLKQNANYYVEVNGGTVAEDNVIWSDNSDGASHSSQIGITTQTDWINGYKVSVN